MNYEGVPGFVESRDAYGETTVVVERGQLVEAARYFRDELGFNFLSDISPADYHGWGSTGVAGYWGSGTGRDINAPGSWGLHKLPDPKPKRFSVSYHLLALPYAPSRSWGGGGGAMPEGTVRSSTGPEGSAPPAASGGGGAGLRPAGAAAAQGREEPRRIRLQVWCDDGEPLPSVIGVWPTADWHEREAWDMMGIQIDGHPNLARLLMEDDWEGHPLRKDYPLGGEPVRFSEAE